MTRPSHTPEKAAVLALLPQGEDATLICHALGAAGIRAHFSEDPAALSKTGGDNPDALIAPEEILTRPGAQLLLAALHQQPWWSDLPVLVLPKPGSGERGGDEALEILGPSINATLLERPLRAIALVAAVKAAMRARRRQREVRDLKTEHNAVLASISDAFSVLDRDWRYVYVNKKVAELAGLRKEEMLGRVIWELFPKVVGGEFYERSHRAMKTRQPDHFEIFYEPWGRWLETRIYPAREGLVIFRADITEKKDREAQIRESTTKLKESEDRLRSAVEAADIGTFDFYPPTGELRWSNRCNELFGLPPDGKVDYATYISGIHPDDRHIISETVQGVLKPGSSGYYNIEYRTIGVRNRKERWVAEKGRAILDSAGHATRFIGTIIDITEAKNAAMALERAKKEAEEANRAKDQFLAMLSHELRTPLTPVLMTIAALRRDPSVSDHFQHDLEVLQRNVELEALLIDDLLDLTRIAHGKFTLHQDATNIHSALEQALSISKDDLARKNLQVTRDFQAGEHQAWADAGRLQQVFWNLIKNAVKFTPAGGNISISTRNEAPHRILIEVKDTGIGIKPEAQPRIFEAFYQGDQSVTAEYGGLGLGLAICKRVIDLHNGAIAVASAGSGQGATFTINLPAMETSLLEGPPFLLDFGTRQSGPAAILLVEDHADTARVVRRILETAGYNVGYAATLQAARDLAAGHPFDLVISDLGLPDGTGLDLMRQLRDAYGLKGIALSGFGSDEDLVASKNAGFLEHLTKPVDWERLRDAIIRILAPA